MTTLVYILIALAVGFVLGWSRSRTRSFQNSGEVRVACSVQESFGAPDYHLMNHVTLRLADGTTQVDHILVSRFGIFVMETKDYSGWIFANAKSATWTQVLFAARFKFQNPIFQNLRHVRAVQELLDFLPSGAIKSAIVFAGEAEFKTDVPAGVFTLLDFLIYVGEQTEEVMSINRVQFCVGRLETNRLTVSGRTDVEHVEDLHRRHGRTD